MSLRSAKSAERQSRAGLPRRPALAGIPRNDIETRDFRFRSEWLLVLVGSVLYSFLAIVKHYRFQTWGYDLGIYMQAVWQYANLHLPYSTILDNGVPLLGNHFGPILILIAPLYRLFPSGYTLLIVQAVWVCLGVLPVYWWAKKRLPTKLFPFTLGVLYLIHPGIQAALSFEFHLATLAATFLAFVLYYGLTQQWWAYWVWFGLSLLVKEDFLLVLVMFGIYMCFKNWWRQGLLTVGISLGFFLVVVLWIMPTIHPKRGLLHTADRFLVSYLHGKTVAEVVLDPVIHPVRFVWSFVDFNVKRESQTLLLLPFGFFPLLSPLSLIAAPIWYERFQSPLLTLWSPQFQYGATTATIFAFSSIEALAWIWRKTHKRVEAMRFAVYTSAFMYAGFLVTPLWFYPPLYRLARADFYSADWEVREAFKQAIRLVPPTASVVAHDALVPRLANRDLVYTYDPGKVFPATYAVMVKQQNLVSFPKLVYRDIERLRGDGYEVIWDNPSVVVLKKRE